VTRRRVGLLGGTFDPPHLAHLVVAETARVELGLDEVRLLVAGEPWMKSEITPARHRVAMVQAAVRDAPGFVVDDRETRREGHTYTAETLEQLRHEQPGTDWWFVVGADAVAGLPRWHRAADAVSLATFVAATRPGHDLELGEGLLRQVLRLDVPRIEVSSTDLRRRFRHGRAVRYLVPSAVERYVREHGLYRS
jgi:nicotinate-nucleotide adenylyltransferase